MKILYLCTDLGIPILGWKGASVHVRAMVDAFVRAGHSVVLASPFLNKSLWEEQAKIKARLFHMPPGGDTEAVFTSLKAFNEMLGVENSLPGELRRILYNEDMVIGLKRRFENNPPDFIYERGSLYSTVGISVARELNLPVLVELNAPLAIEQSAYRGTGIGELAALAERWMLKRADAVHVVSDTLREYVVSLGVEPGRIHVFPNGIDPKLFHPNPPNQAVRNQLGLGNGPVMGFVGGLRRWHGVEVLPTLLERLTEHYPDLCLVIIGDGPVREELENGFRERGLAESAVFTGSVPHDKVADFIRQFDVALAPYPKLDHSFYFSPLKLFEYMACGISVVAAELGQIANVVRDGETGLLYQPGDLDALTVACKRLLSDSALRWQLGQAATKDIHSHYTWDDNAARVTELARTLIQARGSVS